MAALKATAVAWFQDPARFDAMGAETERFVADLSRDLESGAWDRLYGHLRTQPFFEGSLRLIIGQP